MLKQYESLYNDRDKQRNSAFTKEYVRHFTEGGYIPGIETEYALISQVAQAVPVEQVNKYIQDMIGDTNIVISLTGPEKEGLAYPTDEELLRDFMKAQQIPVEPYRETLSDEPLIPSLPGARRDHGKQGRSALRCYRPDIEQRHQSRVETHGLQKG